MIPAGRPLTHQKKSVILISDFQGWVTFGAVGRIPMALMNSLPAVIARDFTLALFL